MSGLVKKLRLSKQLREMVKPLARQPAAIAYTRMMERPVYLSPKIKGITLSYSTAGPSKAGIRAFVREQIPNYKFHNPHLTFKNVIVNGNKNAPSVMSFTFDDDTQTTFDVTLREEDELLGLIEAVNKKYTPQETEISASN